MSWTIEDTTGSSTTSIDEEIPRQALADLTEPYWRRMLSGEYALLVNCRHETYQQWCSKVEPLIGTDKAIPRWIPCEHQRVFNRLLNGPY